MDHRPSPDDRLLLVLLEEAHRHDLYAETLRRDHLAVVGRHGGLCDLHCADDVRAVYVDVQDADTGAVVGKRDSQVHGDGGFAHSALAAVDAHLVLDLRERLGDRALLRELPTHGFDLGPGLRLLLGIHWTPRRPRRTPLRMLMLLMGVHWTLLSRTLGCKAKGRPRHANQSDLASGAPAMILVLFAGVFCKAPRWSGR